MFDLAPGVVWPAFNRDKSVNWSCVQADDGPRSLYHSGRSMASIIVHNCGYQPRKVLRAIRRIEAAAAWCEARVAGLKRQAEEILRQQASATEQLEAMAALQALAGDKARAGRRGLDSVRAGRTTAPGFYAYI